MPCYTEALARAGVPMLTCKVAQRLHTDIPNMTVQNFYRTLWSTLPNNNSTSHVHVSGQDLYRQRSWIYTH